MSMIDLDAGTVTLPLATALTLAAVVAVYADARRFGRRHGWKRGFPSLGPVFWAVCVAVVPVVALPWYVVRRVRLTRSPTAREAAEFERHLDDAIAAEVTHQARRPRTSS
jgi:hypothetical protein